MKNAIIFNYNLIPENLVQNGDESYSFFIDYIKYNLVKLDRPKEDLKVIYELSTSLSQNYHRIIPNKVGSYFTTIEKSDYVLLKSVSAENLELNLNDILHYQVPVKVNDKLARTNWSALWGEKVDYLEYQVSELATNHPLIKKSFSYYVGLAENAIEYFNFLNPQNLTLCVAHRRVKYPIINANFLNPLNVVIDYRARDIASYIKAKFFYDEDDIKKEVSDLLTNNSLTPLEYNLIFCRLLYPSYYFDKLTTILEDNANDEILIPLIEKIQDYEEFLRYIYTLFSKKSSMLKIDWLIKTS